MQSFKVIWLSGLSLCLACSSAWATDPSLLFDKPLHEKHVPLPPDPYNPQQKATLSCFYYPHLMVKQIDIGEVGAEQLSMNFVENDQSKLPCHRKNAKDEKLVSAWGGYFKGVKGNYVFFDSADGSNGGLGFAVFSSINNKIFEDVAGDIHSIELMTPVMDINQRPWYESPIRLRYQRVYLAPCSVRSDEKKCWNTIRQVTGLTEETPPDCSASYEAEEEKAAPERIKETTADSSVMRYEVEVVLNEWEVIRVTPVSKATECYPAE